MVQINKIFQKVSGCKGFLVIEKIMLLYLLLTTGLALWFWNDVPTHVFAERFYILVGLLILRYAFEMRSYQVLYYLRFLYQVALLGYWYPDIYEFARFMPDTDYIFASIDQWIFGCQPSLMLSKWLTGFWWEELFNMGYFSYYLMIVALYVVSITKPKQIFNYTTTMMVGCFIVYYVIYIFLESAGPQYYFQHIGMEQAMSGIFPNIGNWFFNHTQLVHPPLEREGLFVTLVHYMQGSEMPIAAFPSSHVGLSTIMTLLAWKINKKLGYVFLPFYCILCVSTVYIGAHYAVDVLGGWISAILIFYVMHKVVTFLLKKENGILVAE